MGDLQMLFPMEPEDFWQKLKTIVVQIVIEHNNTDIKNKRRSQNLLYTTG